jgi:DNA invertase Pin-like site-specific DNA recombinase
MIYDTRMSEIIGYSRVSTASQCLDVQLEKLKEAGCDKVFSEKKSGRQYDNRLQLQACLSYVREGDILVISRLDRMARSVLDLAKIADTLQKKGVSLRVLDQAIDTTTSEGRLMFSLLGAFAAFEADIRSERQFDGIKLAQAKGVRFGRKNALTEDQKCTIRRLKSQEGFSVGQLQNKYQVGRATIYRALEVMQD